MVRKKSSIFKTCLDSQSGCQPGKLRCKGRAAPVAWVGWGEAKAGLGGWGCTG